MPTKLEWSGITIRIVCTLLAGALFGFNRGEHGRPAGLRTTMLVSLAACLSMIQVNVLLPIAGKSSDSFVVMDLMRLPLGILSGMGFIGAGAILRRDTFVVGVTTAATLWFTTVIGLCFGGGQIWLGLAGSIVGILVLAGMRPLEERMRQDRQGNLVIAVDPSGPDEHDVRAHLEGSGLKILSYAFEYDPATQRTELNCNLQWEGAKHESKVPDVIHALARRPGVTRIAWNPQTR